jgi:prepilin signal peptidase PulO-like enzyme (type II secretory pathway)
MIIDIYIILILFFLGACIGSFLNALCEKLYRGENFVTGRSSCDSCHHQLQAIDLIPVVSYIWLWGKCRYCKAHIPIDLFVSEVFCGIFFALAYPVARPLLGVDVNLFSLYFFFILFNISFFFFVGLYDYKYMVILDMPVYVLSGIYFVIIGGITLLHYLGYSAFYYANYVQFFLEHVISAVALFVLFLLIYLITKGRGMGGGDVKLAFLIGLLLGAKPSVVFLYVAFFSGALISLILLLYKSKGMKDSIPFGPFLAFGVIIAILYSGVILSTPLFNFVNYIGVLL